MIAERLITSFARRLNRTHLKFSPATGFSIPPPQDSVPTLLYLHVPFCEELCPYCSFHRVAFQESAAREYFAALRKEIGLYKSLGYDFQALYVGGGTPTVLMDELARTLELVCSAFAVREVSVETNPNHLNAPNLEAMKRLGVNRLSVGVQSFDERLLRAMERYHKYGSGAEIAEKLRRFQGIFDTLNVDMMFNFPLQTSAALEKDLSVLLGLAVDQVTYYPLMASPSTQALVSRSLGTVTYRREKAFYRQILSALSPNYRPSTAWCFSRSRAMIDEYVVHYEQYAGLGSGSIGYLGGSAYANTFDLADYIRDAHQGKLPLLGKKAFSAKDRARYDFLMKLFGLKLDLAASRPQPAGSLYRHLWPEILFFRLLGGVKKKGSVLTLTARGQYFWVIMMREFFIAVNNFRDFCRAGGLQIR